jgi:hypothetical protein
VVAFSVPKGPARHHRWGKRYLWAYTVVFLTAIILSVQRWSADAYLFGLAVLGYSFALGGYSARRFRQTPWLRHLLGEWWVIAHLVGMISSYVVLWTALYVDNAHLFRSPELTQTWTSHVWCLVPASARAGAPGPSGTRPALPSPQALCLSEDLPARCAAGSRLPAPVRAPIPTTGLVFAPRQGNGCTRAAKLRVQSVPNKGDDPSECCQLFITPGLNRLPTPDVLCGTDPDRDPVPRPLDQALCAERGRSVDAGNIGSSGGAPRRGRRAPGAVRRHQYACRFPTTSSLHSIQLPVRRERR